jgi:hypothetical protein
MVRVVPVLELAAGSCARGRGTTSSRLFRSGRKTPPSLKTHGFNKSENANPSLSAISTIHRQSPRCKTGRPGCPKGPLADRLLIRPNRQFWIQRPGRAVSSARSRARHKEPAAGAPPQLPMCLFVGVNRCSSAALIAEACRTPGRTWPASGWRVRIRCRTSCRRTRRPVARPASWRSSWSAPW